MNGTNVLEAGRTLLRAVQSVADLHRPVCRHVNELDGEPVPCATANRDMHWCGGCRSDVSSSYWPCRTIETLRKAGVDVSFDDYEPVNDREWWERERA